MKTFLLLLLTVLLFDSTNAFAKCYRRAGGTVIGNLVGGDEEPLVEVKCDMVLSNLVNYGGSSHPSRARIQGTRVCGIVVAHIVERIPRSDYEMLSKQIEMDRPVKTVRCRHPRFGFQAIVEIFDDGEATGYLFNK